MLKLIKVAVVCIVPALGACSTTGVTVQHGELHNGNSADVVTANMGCGSGKHVTTVTYDQRGNIKGQSSTAHGDLCGDIVGGAARIAAGAVSGGATATVETAATAVAVSN